MNSCETMEAPQWALVNKRYHFKWILSWFLRLLLLDHYLCLIMEMVEKATSVSDEFWRAVIRRLPNGLEYVRKSKSYFWHSSSDERIMALEYTLKLNQYEAATRLTLSAPKRTLPSSVTTLHSSSRWLRCVDSRSKTFLASLEKVSTLMRKRSKTKWILWICGSPTFPLGVARSWRLSLFKCASYELMKKLSN